MSKAVQVLGEMTPDNLIADTIHPIDTESVEIETGSATLVRGSLITSTGALASASSDTVVGILAEDVAQNSASKTQATMYISGSFNADAITVSGSSVTAKTFKTALRQLGIFLK